MVRDEQLDTLVDQLAARQHGAFTLTQIRARCSYRVASARASSDEWMRFLPGTYFLPTRRDRWTDAAAMCLHAPEATLAGLAAGQWWDLDGLPRSVSTQLIVPSTCGVRHRTLRRSDDLLPWERRHEDGGCLRVTDPTRTIIDLAGVLDAPLVERATESAIRRGLTSSARLRARAGELRRRGRPGPATVIAMLDARPAGGPADSDGEVVLLQLLRDAGLPPPIRQHRLGPWHFDLAWPLVRVAVELDGRHHRTPQQLAADDRKQNQATLRGWLVLRFTWDRVAREPELVVGEILAAFGSRGASLSPRFS